MSIFAAALNISPVRCWIVPVPEDPNVSWPGAVFAYAISSCRLAIGSERCTTRMFFISASIVIGVKSLTGSKGNFEPYSVAFAPCVPPEAVPRV